MIEDHDNPAQDAIIDTADLRIKKVSESNPEEIEIQYSYDNTTWNDFKYVYPSKGYSSQGNLPNSTTMYIRGRNSSCSWTYLETETFENGGTTMDNVIGLLAIALVFVYFLLYKKNRLFGGIAYLCIGVGLISFATTPFEFVLSIIMMAGSFIMMIYDILREKYMNK